MTSNQYKKPDWARRIAYGIVVVFIVVLALRYHYIKEHQRAADALLRKIEKDDIKTQALTEMIDSVGDHARFKRAKKAYDGL